MTALNGRKILIVDDEGEIRDLFCDEFRRLGASVDQAPDGIVAFDLVSKANYDIVISDICMPSGDGLTLARKIYERNPQSPRVFLCTGFGKEKYSFARDFGVHEIFRKPFDLGDMAAVVAASLQSTAA